jgi:hypothetical protein
MGTSRRVAQVEGKEDQFEENVVNDVQTDYRRGVDGAIRHGGQIGDQQGDKRLGVDAQQVMSPSNAAAAAVGICYYNWNFGDEAYSCKISTVRPCIWQEIDIWWHVNAFVPGDLNHIVNQCLAGVLSCPGRHILGQLNVQTAGWTHNAGPVPWGGRLHAQLAYMLDAQPTSCLSTMQRTIVVSIVGPAAMHKGLGTFSPEGPPQRGWP